MKYVLDTNAVSALMKGEDKVTRRLARKARADVYVPEPVLAEIAYGIERLSRSRRRDALRARFDLIRQELTRATWSDDVSEAFGAIKARLERAGQRIEDFDVAVGAHAAAMAAVLVTANLGHMSRIPGIEIEDWENEP
ncbi:MAG TPA: PIN domain-containing protein [Polyangia bacterium]|nr:PIN domain-containing protein [Polyangia bacterium]